MLGIQPCGFAIPCHYLPDTKRVRSFGRPCRDEFHDDVGAGLFDFMCLAGIDGRPGRGIAGNVCTGIAAAPSGAEPVSVAEGIAVCGGAGISGPGIAGICRDGRGCRIVRGVGPFIIIEDHEQLIAVDPGEIGGAEHCNGIGPLPGREFASVRLDAIGVAGERRFIEAAKGPAFRVGGAARCHCERDDADDCVFHVQPPDWLTMYDRLSLRLGVAEVPNFWGMANTQLSA